MFLNALLVFLLLPLCTSRDTIKWNQHLKDDGDLLVSKENNFKLGFFSPGNSSYRYVGIWYAQVSEQTVVWIANRNNPINDTSGVLRINRYGQLVLYAYNMEDTPVWSTIVSVQTTSTCTAQLLDTGNLVLFQDNTSESFKWQSFDYPTDTLLPGMKVGWNLKTGLEWVLTSWKSQDDPGTGDYTLRLQLNPTATPQYILYKGLTPHWRSDPVPWHNYVSNREEMYFILVNNNTSVILREVLSYSGLLHQVTWDDGDPQWNELWGVPKYRCDQYGQCGANSKCSPDNINMFQCECLPGYKPKSVNDWERRDGSGGCVSKRVGVSKCRNGEGFVKVARAKDPDTSKAARLETSMSAKECREECLRNCSCTAFSSLELEGQIDCLTWYGELMDILVHSEVGRDLYVRVDAIELGTTLLAQENFNY